MTRNDEAVRIVTGATPIPILLYHSVTSDPPDWIAPYTVTPDSLSAQLDLLVADGRTSLTVSDLVDRLDHDRPLPERPVVITFDDGFEDTMTAAAPALTERGLAATVFVTTGALRGDGRHSNVHALPARMLHWSQLAQLEALGVEIGAHAHTHPELDAVSISRAADEVWRSKELLEEALSHRVDSFAYPHGYADRRVMAVVRGAGFTSACAVKNAISSSRDDRFDMARLTVQSTTRLSTVRSWLAGAGAPIAPLPERLRTRGWRWYRRVKGIGR
jgi:peptidoglycan/xylan/chitin deacetylase (PgdA/CDA1 family)